MNSNSRPPANRAKEGTTSVDLMSLVSMSGLVLLYGLTIALYTVTVRHSTFHTNSQDCVRRAAVYLAHELSTVYVDDPVFGKVGLADSEPSDATANRITSLNRLYATLRADSILAKQLSLQQMATLAQSDLQRLHKIQSKLQGVLERETDSNVEVNGPHAAKTWYVKAYHIVKSADNSDETLFDLHLKPGSLKPEQFTSGMPGMQVAGDGNILQKGQYKTGIKIRCTPQEKTSIVSGSAATTVTNTSPPAVQLEQKPGSQTAPRDSSFPVTATSYDWLSFYQLANQPRLIDNNLFSTDPTPSLPSAVLVEATFKSSQHTQKIDIVRTRMACGIAGGIKREQQASLFMVSFPHGLPPGITSLRQLLMNQGTTGEWQQSVTGEVPGNGHLAAPAVIDSGTMAVGEAVTLSFYHWLRAMGPDVNVDQVSALLDREWDKIPIQRDFQSNAAAEQTDNPNNAALTKDTGARAFSLLYQSGPGGAGQAALRAAFDGSSERVGTPHSALPLFIDENGNCTLGRQKPFDAKFVSDFLSAIYDTNLASVESQKLAQSVVGRMQSAIQHTTANLNLRTEELNSIIVKLQQDRIQPEPVSARIKREIPALERRRNELDAYNAADELQIKQYSEVIARAKIVIANAEEAASETFDVAAHLDRYARDGIAKKQPNKEHDSATFQYALGDDMVFTPVTKAVTEEEIYKPQEEAIGSRRSWISKQFTVVDRIPGPSEDTAIAAKQSTSYKPVPRFVLIDSRSLSGKQDKNMLVLPRSPFAGTGIPDGQLSYYAQDAVRTTGQPAVGWSVLIRDLVANRQTGGEPVPSKLTKWFSREEMQGTATPGLAVEVQVRAPVPLLQDLPLGDSLANPTTQEHVSQIPPMPPTML